MKKIFRCFWMVTPSMCTVCHIQRLNPLNPAKQYDSLSSNLNYQYWVTCSKSKKEMIAFKNKKIVAEVQTLELSFRVFWKDVDSILDDTNLQNLRYR
ncbi:hypothetical protein BgiMline_022045 [Biomphalaria glabrata]|nr:hypothetical protein BgiMline_009938 [Biomphalaria glabrata]